LVASELRLKKLFFCSSLFSSSSLFVSHEGHPSVPFDGTTLPGTRLALVSFSPSRPNPLSRNRGRVSGRFIVIRVNGSDLNFVAPPGRFFPGVLWIRERPNHPSPKFSSRKSNQGNHKELSVFLASFMTGLF